MAAGLLLNSKMVSAILRQGVEKAMASNYNIYSDGPPLNATPADDRRWQEARRDTSPQFQYDPRRDMFTRAVVSESERRLIAETQSRYQVAVERADQSALQGQMWNGPPLVATLVVAPVEPEPVLSSHRELDLEPVSEIGQPKVRAVEIEF